jgi:hypothetical protein
MYGYTKSRAVVKNVIIFIIRVLKLLVMQGKYILLALVAILILIPPSMASLNKITAGAPVFIGESNLDITRALNDCRIISWWPEGGNRSMPAEKTITLRPLNEVTDATSHYTISPSEYSNYPGKWYCAETAIKQEVFEVRKPEIKISIWDLDAGKDVSGSTLSATANITYRIDTNLDAAYPLKYRPERSPSDLFYTVRLTNPSGGGITNIYTGSYGAAGTEILLFDNTPVITSSPYYWKAGSSWNRTAKNIQGDLLYPAGSYTITVSQNLNGMQAVYNTAGITDTDGLLTSSASVIFTQPRMVIPTSVPVQTTGTLLVTSTTTVSSEPALPTSVIPPETATPVPVKTTYAPVPAWIVLAGLCIGSVIAAAKRK